MNRINLLIAGITLGILSTGYFFSVNAECLGNSTVTDDNTNLTLEDDQ